MITSVGRIDASLLVSAMAVAVPVVVAISALTVWAGPDDEDRHDLAEQFFQEINAQRAAGSAHALERNSALSEHTSAAARAMAHALAEDPRAPLHQWAPDPERLQADLPTAADIRQVIWVTPDLEQLQQRVSEWQDAQEAEMTHVALAVHSVPQQDDGEALVTVGLVARLLPSIDPELVNRGQRDFYLSCDSCGRDNLAQLHLPRGEPVGTASISCPHCGQLIDTFGIDRNGDYHRPSSFLRGFSPSRIDGVGFTWLYVLRSFRYVDDSRRYGRDEVWQTSRETYADHMGDCEDTSILLADWLAENGFAARVVLGKYNGGGHAWVVVSGGGQDYILETTGGPRGYRRVPPRASVLPHYHPNIQFHRKGIWYRSDRRWTSDYGDGRKWLEGKT